MKVKMMDDGVCRTSENDGSLFDEVRMGKSDEIRAIFDDWDTGELPAVMDDAISLIGGIRARIRPWR